MNGAYLETTALGKPARSDDGTLDIIEKYKDNPKISVDYVNLQTDKDHRNVGLERLKKANCDWALIIDGDECYHEFDFAFIRKQAQLFDNHKIKAAYFKSQTFVNDFKTFTWQEFPRLLKITPEATFINDNFLQWKDASWAAPHVIKSNMKYFHYSFLKGAERFHTKSKWWQTRFRQTFRLWMDNRRKRINFR